MHCDITVTMTNCLKTCNITTSQTHENIENYQNRQIKGCCRKYLQLWILCLTREKNHCYTFFVGEFNRILACLFHFVLWAQPIL